MSTLFHILYNLVYHTKLTFYMVKEALDPLTEKEQQIVRVVSLIDLQRHMKRYRWYGKGT